MILYGKREYIWECHINTGIPKSKIEKLFIDSNNIEEFENRLRPNKAELETVRESFTTHARLLFKNNFDVVKVVLEDNKYICTLQCHSLTISVIESFELKGFAFIICGHSKEGIEITFAIKLLKQNRDKIFTQNRINKMNNSEKINEIAKALCEFQGSQKPISFDSKNPFFKSKYASLTAIVEGCKEGLKKNGLSVSQLINIDTLTTILMHSSGQFISTDTKLSNNQNKGLSESQSFGFSVSYARRYSYASLLGVVSDEDMDGNTPEGQKPSTKETVTKPTVKEPDATLKERGEIFEMSQDIHLSEEQQKAFKEMSNQKILSSELAQNIINKLAITIETQKKD